jgi:hypothetical protein
MVNLKKYDDVLKLFVIFLTFFLQNLASIQEDKIEN